MASSIAKGVAALLLPLCWPAHARAEGVDPIRCYPGQRSGAAVERICESADIVTVETLPAGPTSPAPPEPVRRLHDSWSRFVSRLTSPGEPSPEGSQSRWTGLGLSILAVGTDAARDWVPGARVGLGLDAALAPGSPFTLGVAIGQRYVVPAAARGSDYPQVATDLGARLGWAFTPAWRVSAFAGWSAETAHRGRTGWHAGVATDHMLDERWSLTLEYRYTRLQPERSRRWDGAGPSARLGRDASALLGGVTYRFFGL